MNLQMKYYLTIYHCVKKGPYSELFWSAFSRIWTKYGDILRISPNSVQMRENTDQGNSEYEHFLRSYPVNLLITWNPLAQKLLRLLTTLLVRLRSLLHRKVIIPYSCKIFLTFKNGSICCFINILLQTFLNRF